MEYEPHIIITLSEAKQFLKDSMKKENLIYKLIEKVIL